MSVKSTENFLGAFEKSFSSKSEVLSEYFSLISASLLQNMNFADEIIGNFYSKEFIRKRVLKQTQEEIEEIDKQIENEKLEGGGGEGEPEDEYASYTPKNGEILSEKNRDEILTSQMNDIFKKVLEDEDPEKIPHPVS